MKTQEIKTITDLVWDYFNEHPEKELSPDMVFIALTNKHKKLKINYSSINSAINRFHLQKIIFRTSRGKYSLKLPLSRGQLRIDDVIKPKENE
jgi:hypothetical protein